MQQEQSRRDWEEEAQRRYELEQLAEADRDQRVDVSFYHLCLVLLKNCSPFSLQCVILNSHSELFTVEYDGVSEGCLSLSSFSLHHLLVRFA